MGITQNGVVWITNRGARISLCIVNFAMIAKFRYDSEIRYHSEIASIAKFAILAKIWHSENFARIVKFLLPLQSFRNPCEIFAMP